MSKHIDLVAVGCLLLAIAVFSGVKHVVLVTFSGPVHYLRMTTGPGVRVSTEPLAPEAPMPPLPRISVQRD